MVGERLRRRAGTALAAVDSEEVGRAVQAAPFHRLGQLVHELPATDGGLDPHRLAGQLAYLHDHVEQFVHVAGFRMAVWRQRILADRDAADAGDFLGHLGRGENAALARLGPLRQLDLEGTHLLDGGQFLEADRVEVAVGVAHAVFGGADLEDDVATTFQVMRAEAALAGIHPGTGHLRTARQRAHRRFRDCPVAHAGDVDQRVADKGLVAPAFADDQWRRRLMLAFQHGKGSIDEDQRAGLVEVVGRAETEHAALVLGHAVDPGARRPVEGHFVAVAEEEVLAEIFAQALEEEAQVADHRVIAQHRVALLRDVADVPVNQPDEDGQRRQDTQADAEDPQQIGHACLQTVQFRLQNAA